MSTSIDFVEQGDAFYSDAFTVNGRALLWVLIEVTPSLWWCLLRKHSSTPFYERDDVGCAVGHDVSNPDHEHLDTRRPPESKGEAFRACRLLTEALQKGLDRVAGFRVEWDRGWSLEQL